MNVLIIGLGSIGKRHLNNILEHREEWGIEQVFVHDTNVKAVLGPDKEDGVWIGADAPYTYIPSGTELVSALSFVNAVLICTPPKYHYKYTVLVGNVHVLVEKPLSYNLPWKDEMGTDRLVLAAMNLRFHKGVNWARRQVKEGVVGTPRLGKAWYGYNGILKNRPDSPDAKLGPLVSAIHDLDALLWALGGVVDSAPLSVRRKMNINQKEEYFKKWGFVYGLADDARTVIKLEADFLAHIRRRGMHIIGEDGEVLIEATGTGTEHIVNIVNEELKWEGQNDINDMYVEELDSFFALCRGDIKREESRLPDVLEVLKLAKALGVKNDLA